MGKEYDSAFLDSLGRLKGKTFSHKLMILFNAFWKDDSDLKAFYEGTGR